MKTFKTSLLTIATLLCSIAASAFEVDGIYYNITSSGNLTVEVTYKGWYSTHVYDEYIGEVIIPDSVTYNGTTYSVTRIGSEAFYHCSSLTIVTIPNSVTSIGSEAFSGCSRLYTVINNSDLKIYAGSSDNGGVAYYAKVVIDGDRNEKVGDYYFRTDYYGNHYLSGYVGKEETLILPENYKGENYRIDEGVFYGHSELKNIIIGAGILSIGSDQTQPAKVIWLTNTPPSGYNNLSGKINYVANYQYSSFSNAQVYPYLSSMFEVNGVKYVPVNMSERTCDAIDCRYDSSVENVSINSTVSYRGIEMKVMEVMPYTFCNNDYIKELTISNQGVIGEEAFEECSALTSVTLGESVTSIESSAFASCQSLKEIDIPNSVTTLGSSCFSGCTEMKSAAIGNGITAIESSTFKGCSSLQQVIIGNGVTDINASAFSECSALQRIQWGENIKTIGYQAFSDCIGLTTVTVPQSVTKIESSAFRGCTALTGVFIEERVDTLSLNSTSFADCPLDSVYIGGNIDYTTSPFYCSTSLRSVVIGDNAEAVYDNEFYGCTNLKNVSIGNSVKSIGSWAFSGCSSLEQFAFGGNVKSIGQEAFSDCTNMTQLISSAVVPPTCGAQALEDINKWNCTLKVPESYKAAYQAADQWKDFFFIEDVMEVLKFQLTFMVDGEVYHTEEVALSATIVVPDVPTKEGHTFSGWSEVPETMPANDVTVEGSFTVNTYTLMYMVDGEVYAADSITYGEAIVAKEVPTKEGHTFSGWSEIPETMPANDVTVEGTFTVNKYQIVYMVDGEVYAADSIAYGETIVLMEAPVKEGYLFSGWSEVPETMPAEDVTVEGSFTVDGIEAITIDRKVDVYTLQGVKIREQIPVESLKNELPRGIYIVNGKKMVVR